MHSAPKVDVWLPYRRPRPGARVRLFCFPFAGGGASVFHDFQEGLPPHVEVLAVQLPGREGRLAEALVPEMTRLVPMIADSLTPHLTLPFALLGCSMGARIAFELARELRRRGVLAGTASATSRLLHLFALACPAPHLSDDDVAHTLPDAALIERLRTLGGMREEVLAHRELMELLLPVFRADAAVTETYACADEPPLDAPLTVIGGLSDAKVDRAALDAWRQHTTGAFALALVPGGHLFVQTARARQMVLAKVARELG